MAFFRVPPESCWRFYALSLRFHCAFTALASHALRFHRVRTALSWRLHCADGVLKTQWHLKSGTVAIRIQIQHIFFSLSFNFHLNDLHSFKNIVTTLTVALEVSFSIFEQYSEKNVLIHLRTANERISLHIRVV